MFEKRPNFWSKVFEKLFIFTKVGMYKEFAGQEEEGGFGFGIFMLVEMCVDKVGDLYFVVYIVCHAIFSHITDLLHLEL